MCSVITFCSCWLPLPEMTFKWQLEDMQNEEHEKMGSSSC